MIRRAVLLWIQQPTHVGVTTQGKCGGIVQDEGGNVPYVARLDGNLVAP